jgi:hypothetical protein
MLYMYVYPSDCLAACLTAAPYSFDVDRDQRLPVFIRPISRDVVVVFVVGSASLQVLSLNEMLDASLHLRRDNARPNQPTKDDDAHNSAVILGTGRQLHPAGLAGHDGRRVDRPA